MQSGYLAAVCRSVRGLAALGLALALGLAPAGGCGNTSDSATAFQEGYYTAEATSFDSLGWKRFISIYVNQDRIVTVEYNAKNASGFLRSWDMDNMRLINSESGTYPNKYIRSYAGDLLNRQDPALVDPVPGAVKYLKSFQLLAEAAIGRARKGDKNVAFVELPDIGEEAIRVGEASLYVSAAQPSPAAKEPSSEPSEDRAFHDELKLLDRAQISDSAP